MTDRDGIFTHFTASGKPGPLQLYLTTQASAMYIDVCTCQYFEQLTHLVNGEEHTACPKNFSGQQKRFLGVNTEVVKRLHPELHLGLP